MIKKLGKKMGLITTSQEKPSSDLGFGTIVTQESRSRLINKDGSFNVRRRGLNFFTSLSLYHHLLTMTWVQFTIVASLGYFLMNLAFAFAYIIFGTGLGGSKAATFFEQLIKAFFFSVQTSSTIGYGHIAPETFGANLLVTLESFIGLMGIALVTGMVFARFSRPTARILFSTNAIISPYKEITAFMFRISNARHNQIIELEAQLHFSCILEKDGKRKREFHRLNLERNSVPFFPLSWTIVHPIDKDSPIYNMNHDDLLQSEAEFMILLTGMDDTFNQTVFSRSSYKAAEMIFNARFNKIYETDGAGGTVTIDISRLSEIEKL
jgi:inward rectifier potassium channel